MFAYRAVRAPHAGVDGTAPDALKSAMPMNVLSGWSLKATVPIGGSTAVDTAPFVMIVLMQPIGAFWAARAIVFGTAIDTFRSHNYPLYKPLI